MIPKPLWKQENARFLPNKKIGASRRAMREGADSTPPLALSPPATAGGCRPRTPALGAGRPQTPASFVKRKQAAAAKT